MFQNKLKQFCIILIQIMKMHRAMPSKMVEQGQLKEILIAQLN